MAQFTVKEAFHTALQHHQAGQLPQAEILYMRVLARQPDHADAWHLVGVIASQVGRHALAVDLIRRAIVLNPRYCEAHSNLGNALRDEGQLDEAIAAYRQAIALNPNLGEVYGNLGNALRDKGRLDEAVAACRQAVVLKPDWAQAHSDLADALRLNGQLDEAIAAYRRAVALRPDFPEAWGQLGVALKDNGQLDEAVTAQRQAIAQRPDFAEAYGNLGVALMCLGKFDDAADSFGRALELNPRLGAVHQNLAELGQHRARPADIHRLGALAADESLPVDDRVKVGFALGKVLDDADRFDEAFAAYAQANSLPRAARAAVGERFDPEALARGVNEIIGEFTSARCDQIGRPGSLSETPVFIVGMPRSGTSLVEQIAASHPQVFGAGETEEVSRLADALGGWGMAGGSKRLDLAAAATLADVHVRRLAVMSGGAARVIDKTLDNVFRLALIAALFPASRIIFCRRDARDTCLSCHFHLFRQNLFSRDLRDCARFWAQTDRLMNHWRAVSPLRTLDIRYEDVVADLEGQSRRLIDFLGLPWDKACLDFHRAQRPVLTLSNWQVRQPLYGRSVGRWRHYQRHLGPMLEALGSSASCGDTPKAPD